MPSNNFLPKATNLSKNIFIVKGAEYVLKQNINTYLGLANGSIGIIKEIFFLNTNISKSIPDMLLMKINNYKGETCSNEYSEDIVVPIFPLEREAVYYKTK